MIDAKRKSASGASLVRSLDKALAALELLADIEGDVDLGSLATSAGLPKSTLVRLLGTLRQHNLVHQDPKTRRYRLGWALIYLGKAAERQSNLAQIMAPFLEQLANETGETASLAMLHGHRAVYIAQILSKNIIRGVPPIGSDLQLHCTAVGKILLSDFPDEGLDQLIHQYGLPRMTENTIVNAAHLRRELAQIREKGSALDNEEAEPGGRCIAAPIRDGKGHVIAALSITGPTSRLTVEQVDEYAGIVRSVADQASRSLSFSGD
jgi:IclR family acetate operon transcriptional repressor